MKNVSSVISAPRFARGQVVEFIGGRGRVRDCHCESGSWVYQIEMAKGSAPDFGRIGGETMILLSESDVG